MRDLVLNMSMSLDGFVAGPAGEIDWVFGGDQAAIAWKIETISNASLHIMGSRTFNDMASFWPTATGAFAPPMNEIPKAVFSSQAASMLLGKLQPGSGVWDQAYVAGGDLAEEVAKLKAAEGKPIIAHGGAGFARSLIAQGLVDQYTLLVCPLALGKGLPIFSDLAARQRLRLVSSNSFTGGTMAQVYRPA